MLGNFLTSLIAGIVVLVTLLLLHVPFPFLWALWVALVDFLPMIGGFYEYETGKIALAKSRKISENTGGVQGIVKDTSGDRLIGANIVIKELQIGSQTDSKGYYSIKNIKSGNYILEATFMGYRKFVKRVNINAGSVLEINIVMVPTTFQIGGIEVYGTSELLPKDVSTQTVITSGEIEHFQASSIKDVLDLVPGVQKSANPGLGQTTQMSIRGNEMDQLSAFGTLIIVDGSPVSNNANLQFTQASDAALGISNMGAGIDLRTIPADNIESIEVITGLPSVRYGDFTEGIINVHTKLGPAPNRLKIKNNPEVTEGTFSGGTLLGESGLNYSLNVAHDERNIRLIGDEYYRFTGETVLSNNFFDNQLNNNIKLNLQTVLDNENPTGDLQQIKNYNHGFVLDLSTWGNFKPTDGVSNLEYSLDVNMNRENSMKSHLVQSPLRIVNGDTLASYVGHEQTIGVACNLNGRIEWSRIFYTGDIIHKFLIGSQPQFNANTGQGLLVHGFEHVFEELVEFRRAKIGNLLRLALQHRVAVLHDWINHSSEIPHLSEITFKIAFGFAERIAAEFFQKSLRQHQRHHGLRDYAGGGHHAHIRALIGGQGRFAGDQVHRFERTAQRGDGLQESANEQVLSVGDATLQAAGAIGSAGEMARLPIIVDGVLHHGAEAGGVLSRESQLDAFHGLNGNDGLSQAPIQARVPGGVRSQAGGHAVRDHFEHAARRVARAVGLVHDCFHALFGCGIDAAEQDLGIPAHGCDFFPCGDSFEAHTTDGYHVAGEIDAELDQQGFGNRADGHASCGFTGAGALQKIGRA